jgi:hypothetical protein
VEKSIKSIQVYSKAKWLGDSTKQMSIVDSKGSDDGV